MNCLLLIAGLCIFQPSEFRIEASTSAQLGGNFTYWDGRRDMGGGLLGRVSMTMDVPVTQSLTVRYGVFHESLLDSREDRGQERWTISAVYRPWVR